MMRKALIGFLPVLFLLFLAGSERAQEVKRIEVPLPAVRGTPPPTPDKACPSVNVQVQSAQAFRDGQRISFNADINGGDSNVAPIIVWSISAGTIIQGQGSRHIEVDSSGAGNTPERELKAEIWISGYAPECVIQSSAVAKVVAPAAKFGEFGEVGADAFTTNIKALADFITQSPDNIYLIAYAGRTSERGFTFNWIKRIKDALVEAGVPSRKIIASDGGFREDPLFDFWILPTGAEPPRANPTVKRTEIVYPKTTPAKKP